MTYPSNSRGSFHIAGLLGIVVVLLVAFVGYRIINASHADAPGSPIIGTAAKCLDSGSGKIQLWQCNGSDAQRWVYTSQTIQSLGNCITVPGNSTVNDTALTLAKCDGSSGQAWVYQSDKSLLNPNAKLCLNVAKGDTDNGTRVVVHGCNGTAAQEWSVVTTNYPGSKPAASASVSMATWNTEFDNTSKDLGTQVKTVSASAQIIGLQEVHDPDKRTQIRNKLLCASCAYNANVTDFDYEGSSPASLMILWNRARFVQMGAAGSLKVSDATTVKDSAGTSVSAKYITWVKLRDTVTNKQFYVVDTHTVASVESLGLPDTDNPKRVALYKKHMDALTAQLTTLKSDYVPIFVLGDLNVNYRREILVKNPAFPLYKLGAIGFRSNYDYLNLANVTLSQGTRSTGSDRIIDYIYSWSRNDVKATSERINDAGLGSDHFPVFVTYTMSDVSP